MARRRKGRPVHGILVLNKPAGQTSNRSLQIAKRLYFAAKAGHTGSLDPLATGVLPLCFGEATKFSQYLLDSDKIYRSTFLLGVRTNSSDADGEVIETADASAITEAQVIEALKPFEGDIEQIPSMFSALKHQGQPLYKLARQGLEVERKVRAVTVFELKLEAFRPGDRPEADVYIHASKGTYVRSIAEDMGQALGCGAHVKALHRVKAGPFDESMAVSLSALEALKTDDSYQAIDALLVPMDSALTDMPEVHLAESASFYVQQGQAVRVANAPLGGVVKMISDQGVFLGIGEMLEDGRVTPKRLVVMEQS
jgi:tRNA pseudouridine55 synthase